MGRFRTIMTATSLLLLLVVAAASARSHWYNDSFSGVSSCASGRITLWQYSIGSEMGRLGAIVQPRPTTKVQSSDVVTDQVVAVDPDVAKTAVRRFSHRATNLRPPSGRVGPGPYSQFRREAFGFESFGVYYYIGLPYWALALPLALVSLLGLRPLVRRDRPAFPVAAPRAASTTAAVSAVTTKPV